eukprot:3157475-Pleurochrysis_carterae.AAC.1
MGSGERAVGLIEDLRLCVNQRRSDAELSKLSAAEAEHRPQLRWDSISLSQAIFEPLEPLVSSAGVESCLTGTSGVSSQRQGGSSRSIGGKDVLPSDGGRGRDQPPRAFEAAGTCTAASHTVSQPADNGGAGSSSNPADAGS